MQLAKLFKTPMATSEKLSIHSSNLFEDSFLYRSTVGSLQYLQFTILDLAFAVSKIYQFMHSPRVPHWQAIKRILRYLKNTPQLGLCFS